MKIFPELFSNHDYIIIVGCGRLGAYIADKLSARGKEVLLIDKDEESFNRLSKTYSGTTFIGDAIELFMRGECNIDKASAVVAVTNSDNTNIMVSQIAKEMFHIDKVIARLYNPERECVYDELGIDAICPIVMSADAVEDMLFPNAIIDKFKK